MRMIGVLRTLARPHLWLMSSATKPARRLGSTWLGPECVGGALSDPVALLER